ncbi:MAG TPA: hypothetical protein VHK88_10075 [Aquihabitans sp.]|nr:hypothetical protein [Aquihabitans sp.]
MTHPAIDVDAVSRLRRQLGRAEPRLVAVPTPAPAAVAPVPTTRARALASRLAAPVVARAREELARAARGELAALHAEIDDLREQLDRTRTTHAAEIAVLHEQLRERP